MDGWKEYGVLGYVEDVDGPGVDPDPDFRRALRALNSVPGVRTVSSCQGHLPGEQYEDVLELMEPYVTLVGDGASRAASLMGGAPHFLRSSGGGGKVLVKFSESVIGRWGEVASWLEARLPMGP